MFNWCRNFWGQQVPVHNCAGRSIFLSLGTSRCANYMDRYGVSTCNGKLILFLSWLMKKVKCVWCCVGSNNSLIIPKVLSTITVLLHFVIFISSKRTHHANVLVHSQPQLPRRRYPGLVAPAHLCTHSDQRCGVLGHADGQVYPQSSEKGVIGLGWLCFCSSNSYQLHYFSFGYVKHSPTKMAGDSTALSFPTLTSFQQN